MAQRAWWWVPWIALTMLGCGPEIDDEPIGSLALIPLPVSIAGDAGHLILGEDARIAVQGDALAEAELLAAVLRRSTGYPLEVVSGDPAAGDLALVLDEDLDGLGAEGYELVVDDQGATVRAATAAGVFYGCQTLRQLLPPEVESAGVEDGVTWRLPMVTIEDRPRFAWRGMMLDVARHFFTAEEVIGLIDVAAHYKLNRFHLHLTDDQGWRIEIEAWPDLALVGGATAVGGGEGGYYTKQDYAAIVAYAAARHVTVVPEIDMPGHCNAALASYGELNPDGVPAEPFTGVGVGFSALWLDGPVTMQFVADVLGEVAAITPGPFLHVGGDEAHETPAEDYATFLADVQAIVTGLDKTMVGWDEIGTATLQAPVVAQYWREASFAQAAAAQGAQVIASPAEHAYLDMIYDLDSHVGTMWAGPTDTRDGYEWDPIPEGLGEDDVAGVEAPLWTETVDHIDDVEFLVFPRLLGHAEIGWSPADGREWDEYRTRLGAHGARMESWGLDYYASPLVDW